MAGKTKRLTDEEREKVLSLIRSGVHPEEAFVAVGIARRTFYRQRARARAGDRYFSKLFDDVDQAQSQGESHDVVVTRRAVTPENIEVFCQQCGAPITIDPVVALSLGGQLSTAQSIKASAAQVAIQRLQLRFPQRWQTRILHEVDVALDRFLDAAQGVLAPEVFELVLDAIVRSQGAGETPALEAEQDRLH